MKMYSLAELSAGGEHSKSVIVYPDGHSGEHVPCGSIRE